MSGYFRTFKDKDKKDKNSNNKLMHFCIDDDRLLEKHKTIWSKIEGLKSIKLNALSVYDNRYIKKVYNFCSLNVPVDCAECVTIISIDSLLVYKHKCYL